MIDLATVKARFEENELAFEVIELNDNAKIVVTQYGGRIFGPFLGNGPSFCWINPCFETSMRFREFFEQQEWNLGGDRIWLAPEDQYNVPDANNFWGSYCVPPQVDPGHYRLSRHENGDVLLHQEMVLNVYGRSLPQKNLRIKRGIRKIDNPFKKAKGPRTEFFGYEHEILLEEEAADGLSSEAWNLLQINPEGTMYIPTTAAAQFTEYYEPFEPGYQSIAPNFVQIKIDAQKRFKVGYKSAFTTGRSGYISKSEDKFYLMVRSFYNDPSGAYLKSPVTSPNESGHALHIYNDDGNTGRFAEHECSCLPIGGSTGRRRSSDRISTMYFVDNLENLHEICRLLLGIELRMPKGT